MQCKMPAATELTERKRKKKEKEMPKRGRGPRQADGAAHTLWSSRPPEKPCTPMLQKLSPLAAEDAKEIETRPEAVTRHSSLRGRCTAATSCPPVFSCIVPAGAACTQTLPRIRRPLLRWGGDELKCEVAVRAHRQC